MEFNELLNQYINRINCTAKELSTATGLSPAALSRYRTGERIPNHKQLIKIIDGIASLARDKKIADINDETVSASFGKFLEEASFDYDRFTSNLNTMITTLDISISELARALNFDSSYLSRIRLGQRRPSDRSGFTAGVCQYAVRKKSRAEIAELIGCQAEDISSDSACLSALCEWLSSGSRKAPGYMDNFLKKLDDFNLDEYIRAIRFDELNVPTVPFQIPTSKTYHGIEAMKQGELDFFKSTVLSKSTEPVFMCSDMPMEDMGDDLDFGKKWMFAIAMTLKKGLHLNIIHNIDRPFKEMMLGLESWIPIYMTGQISPYYLKGKHNGVYCHFNYVSGQAALTGECIQGHHNEGKYYLTKNKAEVAYYRNKSNRLLEKACPLMEIYRRDSEKGYNSFLSSDAETEGIRHNILSSLPIYTLPEELLLKILKRSSVDEEDGKLILAFAKKQTELINTVLRHSRIIDDVYLLSREEFEKHPMTLSLSGAFYEKELSYTYEEYTEHLEESKRYAETHTNYTLNTDAAPVFRNIQIHIHEGKWAMVSKSKSPVIHFVIHHPKLREAIERFVPPVVEE